MLLVIRCFLPPRQVLKTISLVPAALPAIPAANRVTQMPGRAITTGMGIPIPAQTAKRTAATQMPGRVTTAVTEIPTPAVTEIETRVRFIYFKTPFESEVFYFLVERKPTLLCSLFWWAGRAGYCLERRRHCPLLRWCCRLSCSTEWCIHLSRKSPHRVLWLRCLRRCKVCRS